VLQSIISGETRRFCRRLPDNAKLNLWIPNEVVHAFVKFRKVGDNSDSKNSQSSVLDPVADLVLAIRKDLGYINKTEGRQTILGTLVSYLYENGMDLFKCATMIGVFACLVVSNRA